MTESHFVYLIAGGAHVKIGHSRNPKSRLSDLSVASAFTLSIVHLWELADRAAAVRLERKLHDTFGVYRANGEWFRIDMEWALAVGDAMLRFDGATVKELMFCLDNMKASQLVVAELEYEEDEEEADLWRTICEGYVLRARTFGLPMTDWDRALAEYRKRWAA